MEPTYSEPSYKPNNRRHVPHMATIIGLFVLLLIITYIIGVDYHNRMVASQRVAVTKENIQMTSVDLSTAEGASRLPVGFPTDIPVETDDIIASNSKVYTDRTPNVVVYTVTFTSKETIAQKYLEYKDYMTKNGFTIDTQDEVNDALDGSKGQGTLLAVVSSLNGQTQVQLNYTEVQ